MIGMAFLFLYDKTDERIYIKETYRLLSHKHIMINRILSRKILIKHYLAMVFILEKILHLLLLTLYHVIFVEFFCVRIIGCLNTAYGEKTQVYFGNAINETRFSAS